MRGGAAGAGDDGAGEGGDGMLTRSEALAAAEAAERYPAGFGLSFLAQDDWEARELGFANEVAVLLGRDPSLSQYG